MRYPVGFLLIKNILIVLEVVPKLVEQIRGEQQRNGRLAGKHIVGFTECPELVDALLKHTDFTHTNLIDFVLLPFKKLTAFRMPFSVASNMATEQAIFSADVFGHRLEA